MLDDRPAVKMALAGTGAFLLVFTAAMAGTAVMITGGVGAAPQSPQAGDEPSWGQAADNFQQAIAPPASAASWDERRPQYAANAMPPDDAVASDALYAPDDDDELNGAPEPVDRAKAAPQAMAEPELPDNSDVQNDEPADADARDPLTATP